MNAWENLKPLALEGWFHRVYHLPETSALPVPSDYRIKLVEHQV